MRQALCRPTHVVKNAMISVCGTYRYVLSRWWGPGSRIALFLMLNPSIADAEIDDATIRRCVTFARREGFDGFFVGNLYALRSTDPKLLEYHDSPVGVANSAALAWMGAESELVICAWGSSGPSTMRGAIHVSVLAAASYPVGGLRRNRLVCFGLTKDHQPRHPSRLANDTPLVPLELNA